MEFADRTLEIEVRGMVYVSRELQMHILAYMSGI